MVVRLCVMEFNRWSNGVVSCRVGRCELEPTTDLYDVTSGKSRKGGEYHFSTWDVQEQEEWLPSGVKVDGD